MFSSARPSVASPAAGGAVAQLGGMITALAELPTEAEDAERIDRIRRLTELESAAAAARAVETARFATSQRAAQAAAGVPVERVGRGVANQVGLAMRCSPNRAQKYVGWAMTLTRELPNTFAALQAGRISEWRAVIVARETIWLSREDRAQVDTELAPSLESLGDRKLEAAVKRIAYRLDPQGYVARSAAAENERRVGVRPAPDCMSRLTGFGPAAQGVAMYSALNGAADAAIAAGDARGRGQIMYDTMVERVTGQATASDVPVELNLVMTDQSVLDPHGPGGNEPAILDGYGPIPAALARTLVLDHDAAPVWLRRMVTAPDTGELIAMESRRREFTPAQRRFLRLRDQTCRTPWCDAPIRHADHIHPAESGGPTTIDNGQGLCQACNHAKQAIGWRSDVVSRAGPHEVDITTPTGHRYTSNAPDPPGRVA
ncbi:MAG TPA: DUF222 domain-containing protein [Jatrophihabitantaceae bacterium]|nr:DUF222 domain-containing protein [Jatrophihabitantaceae bacterium]